MQYVRRGPSQGDVGGGGGPVSDSLSTRLPALWEYLTLHRWEDGRDRRTSTLLLFVDQGSVKVCLNDRDAEASLWVAGRGLEEVLEALETTLRSGSGEWRPNIQKKKK